MGIFAPFAYVRNKLVLDSDAEAFLTATGITDTTITSAINTLVVELKKENLWSIMGAIYPFVGGTANTHKFNLKTPADTNAAFRLNFVGGITHSSSGILPNGTNGYANTFYIPSSNLTVNSTHLSVYIGTNNTQTTSDPVIMGIFNSITQAMLIASKGIFGSRNLGEEISVSQSTRAGYLISTKTSATLTTLYKNGSSVASGNSGGTLPINNILIGNTAIGGSPYNVGWDNNQIRFATIGLGLTASDAGKLNTIVQKFQTTLGRQV
jgi:hypothetical protein